MGAARLLGADYFATGCLQRRALNGDENRVTAMLVTHALEGRSAWFIFAFAGACALGSVYGILQGAWPFGLVEAI